MSRPFGCPGQRSAPSCVPGASSGSDRQQADMGESGRRATREERGVGQDRVVCAYVRNTSRGPADHSVRPGSSSGAGRSAAAGQLPPRASLLTGLRTPAVAAQHAAAVRGSHSAGAASRRERTVGLRGREGPLPSTRAKRTRGGGLLLELARRGGPGWDREEGDPADRLQQHEQRPARRACSHSGKRTQPLVGPLAAASA